MATLTVLANKALHRIAALLRFGMNVKGLIWAARGELGTLGGSGEFVPSST